jgi:hypothetical protein
MAIPNVDLISRIAVSASGVSYLTTSRLGRLSNLVSWNSDIAVFSFLSDSTPYPPATPPNPKEPYLIDRLDKIQPVFVIK